MQQACLNLWQTEMVMNILPLKFFESCDSKNTYLTQFSRLQFVSPLWIRLHKKGFCCVGLTIAWIFLTKYPSFLSSNHHNVLMFLQVQSKFSDFFLKGPETFTSLIPGFFCFLVLFGPVRFIYMTWYDIHHYLQSLLYQRQCTVVPDYHQSV